MSNMISTTLENICIPQKGAIISGPFGSNISSKYFVEKGIPVIRGNNLSLSLDKFYDDGFVFVTKEKAEELNCYADIDDLVFTAAGTIGQVGIITSSVKYKRYVISNKQIRATIDKNKVDPLYAYYWFASPWMQKKLCMSNKGSTVPLLTLWEVKNLPITYPESLDEQKKIVAVFEAIGDKIEKNNNINDELELMARTIYDYWFLQFDFPDENGKPYKSSGGKMVWNEELKREIPEGWKVGELSELASITMGSSPKGESLNENEDGIIFYQGKTDFGNRFPSVRIYTNDPIRYAEEKDILLSVRAPVGDINVADERCCIGRGLAAIHSKYHTFLFYLMLANQYQFDKYNNNGTTFGAITKNDLFKLRIIIPDKNAMKLFESRVSAYDRIILNNEKQNQELVSLREYLLPLLMNGQVGFK